jgi:Beta-lactamase enzyme family
VPPAIVAPAPRSVSFGLVEGTVGSGATRVVVRVDGKRVARGDPVWGRFKFRVSLPRWDVTVRVTALDAHGRRASSEVRPVFGLPATAEPRATRCFEDAKLAAELRALAARFPGIASVYVADLDTGAGAAWNAGARYPAASTLKLAIAVEVMRELDGPPPPGSDLARLLDAMLVRSDNVAANELERWLGGSEPGGAGYVNETMEALGLDNSHLYGGFVIGTSGGARPIPVDVVAEPTVAHEKYTTAWDLARLARDLHLAAGGSGPLISDVDGVTPAEARYLLFVLAHSEDRGKLDRHLPAADTVVLHKAGWIVRARHDNGLVYWARGAFVATVMTWNERGVDDESSDELAGRVAQIALARFRALRSDPAPRRVRPAFAL